MIKKLTEYLKEKYHPKAIILHGSRANGFARKHSDWDFILLGVERISARELVFEQNVEVLGLMEFDEKELIRNLEKFQSAKVVFDTGETGVALLAKARELLAKGFSWSVGWPQGPLLYMKSRVDGLVDNIDRPKVFMSHLGIFYSRSLDYWYLFRHNYSKPVYLAVEEIQEKDPSFYKYISVLASASEPEVKIKAAHFIIESLETYLDKSEL
ncbi:nucleotidyltransferase domain-containing protein [Candidatus Berkelbacteria bacterium]|nr:nucleotidyltransferase domain-containing protein [Candidatus Berkelbacteria bacterium]